MSEIEIQFDADDGIITCDCGKYISIRKSIDDLARTIEEHMCKPNADEFLMLQKFLYKMKNHAAEKYGQWERKNFSKPEY